MSDDPLIPLPPGRAVDIPARFIRQAYEHLQHSGDRYVTFIFAGEMVADAVCYGVSTQRVPLSRMITDQRPPPPPQSSPSWSLDDITSAVVLEVVRQHGPINTRAVCDRLGIPRTDNSLRQRARRVLESMVQARAVRRIGNKRQADFVILRGKRPTETTEPIEINEGMRRRDITDEMIVEQMQHGPISSRTIGDNLGFSRRDTNLRSRITEIIGRMLRENRARSVGGNMGTGRLYELIDEQEQGTA